jgi:hypothetical protein
MPNQGIPRLFFRSRRGRTRTGGLWRIVLVWCFRNLRTVRRDMYAAGKEPRRGVWSHTARSGDAARREQGRRNGSESLKHHTRTAVRQRCTEGIEDTKELFAGRVLAPSASVRWPTTIRTLLLIVHAPQFHVRPCAAAASWGSGSLVFVPTADRGKRWPLPSAQFNCKGQDFP